MIRTEGVRLTFEYAAGAASSRFLTALRDEAQVLGAPCLGCGRVLCPMRSFCPLCFEACGDAVEVGPCGHLLCWTDVPGLGTFGLVRLDGADTGILHRLIGPPDTWRAGARVRARFASERTGRITDILGFEADTQGKP